MKKILLSIFFILISIESNATIKNDIINNLENINNISFKFEQNINGKIESGECTIEYPKKMFCNYDLKNKKILVSNGRSLVIQTLNSYYIYPLEKTPLNFILDKEFLLKKILNSKERIIDDKFINFTFIENNSEVNVFFNKSNFDLVGWQTLDIYQNLSITYLSSVIKNQNIDEKIFILPKQN